MRSIFSVELQVHSCELSFKVSGSVAVDKLKTRNAPPKDEYSEKSGAEARGPEKESEEGQNPAKDCQR